MKRNKLEIIKDILDIINSHRKIKPTPLLRKSNLSSARFKEYYKELINKKLIKKITTDGKEIVLTENGYRYIEKYKDIIGFIEEFEL